MLGRGAGLICLALVVGGCEPLTFTAATAVVGLAAWDMAATPDATADAGTAPMAAVPPTSPAARADVTSAPAQMAAPAPMAAPANDMATRGSGDAADFVVIGSFRNASNAEMMRRAHVDKATKISVTQSKGAPLYRVVVGPFASSGVASAKSEFTRAGVPGTWAIKLCTKSLTPAPCASAG